MKGIEKIGDIKLANSLHFPFIADFFLLKKKWDDQRSADQLQKKQMKVPVLSQGKFSCWVCDDLDEDQKKLLVLYWSCRPSLTAREVPHAEVGFWWRSLDGHPGVTKLSNGLRQIDLITWTGVFYLSKCRHVCVSLLL